MKSKLLLSIAVVCCLITAAHTACAQAAPGAFPKVTIAGSHVRTMVSTSTGRHYDLYIHLPSTYATDKAKNYPVLYILDGQWDFKLMDSVLGGLVYDKFVPEIILVGISYSGESPDYNALRARDYTPSASPQLKGSGDGPKFLAFMKSELIPFVESNYRADPARRLLQGSSLGGLFTLYAMFSDPSYFSGYVAISPAVPWDNGRLFGIEKAYAQSHPELPAKLFLSVGGAEELFVPVLDFGKQLGAHHYKKLSFETRVIEGERHAGNKPEAYNRGLRFLFAESGSAPQKTQ